MADLQTWIDSCIEFEDQPTKEPFGRPNKIFEIIEYEWCKRSHFIPFEMKDIPKGTILEIPPLECSIVTPNWIHPEEKFLRILETKER